MHIRIDEHIPLLPERARDPNKAETLPERVRAYANTARLLAEEGLDLTPTKEDEHNAAKVVTAYAADPESAAKQVTEKKLATLTSASLVEADNILTEFGKQVVHSTTVLRHTITNKLLLETQHPDARVRLKALELLGKISDVGLFAEKTEITVTHQTSDELREVLRQKLEQLRQPQKIADTSVTITDADFEEVFADAPSAKDGDPTTEDDSMYDDDDDVDTTDLQSTISEFDDDE